MPGGHGKHTARVPWGVAETPPFRPSWKWNRSPRRMTTVLTINGPGRQAGLFDLGFERYCERVPAGLVAGRDLVSVWRMWLTCPISAFLEIHLRPCGMTSVWCNNGPGRQAGLFDLGFERYFERIPAGLVAGRDLGRMWRMWPTCPISAFLEIH